jgi:hypothetical protein
MIEQTSQNIYSAQSCVKGSDGKTEPNLKEKFRAIAFPVERSPIHTPIDAAEKTIVSCGECPS